MSDPGQRRRHPPPHRPHRHDWQLGPRVHLYDPTTPGTSPPATSGARYPDQPPRTVTDIHRRHGVTVLTDQYGSTWTYPATGVIPTAVHDPRGTR